MTRSEQRISVKPDTLPNLIADVGSGNYRIPQFQREFVWEKPRIIKLLDSIYHEYPIGSFFLWKAGREHNGLFRHSVALGIPPVGPHDDVSFILDGQQRVTSLYVTLKGLTVKYDDGRAVDYSSISFDLEDGNFTDRKSDNRRYVPVCKMWGPDALMLSQEIDKKHFPAFSKCWQTLQTYPISLVEVRDKDLPAVCEIFQRINQSGKRLDRFDLVAAMTFTTDFDLRERFKKDLQSKLDANRFGKISPTIVTQLLALIKVGQCTERNEFALKTEDIKAHWSNAVSSILLAADTMRKVVGVVNASFLPYDAMLTLLAYYFAKSGNRSLPHSHMDWVCRWFWRAAFGQRYGGGGATRIGQDRELFDELIEGKEPLFSPHIQLTPSSLAKVRMTQTGSAVRNAFLCLLANHKPVHLVNNSPLDLLGGGISEFTNPEKHHIFPRAYLERGGPKGADIYALPNFCFIPAELNKRISDSEPATYFAEFGSENPQLAEAVETHLLRIDPGSGIPENNYSTFLNTRGGMIIDEIGRLCGQIVTPGQDGPQEAGDELENGIDRIPVEDDERETIDDADDTDVGDGLSSATSRKVGRQRREKKVRVPRGQRTDWKTAMVGIDNTALVAYFMQQTNAGRECNLRSRELMFRLGNRRCWFVGARDTHAHVWQRSRFDGDITFWKNGLSHPDAVQAVNKERAVRFDLFSENDFAFFHEAATAKLQTMEWKEAAGRPKKEGGWDETRFFEALGEKGTSVVAVARAIFDWMKPQASRLWWSSGRTGVVRPLFGADGRRLLGLNTQGRVTVPFDKMKRLPPFDDANKRRELLDRLNQVPGISIPEKAVDKWAKIPLRLLKGDPSKLLEVFDWAVKQIKGE